MKVLITGSHGFVGTNLIEALSGEHEIIRWDVKSDGELPDCDVVIHLAGKAHDTKNKTHEDEYFKVNTKLTKKMTVIHRIKLRENSLKPHEKHAYQIMANELNMPHLQVSGIYWALQAICCAAFIAWPSYYIPSLKLLF